MHTPTGKKAILLFGLSLFALIIVTWQGIEGINEMRAALNETYNSDIVPMRLIAEADHAMIVLHRELLGRLLEENSSPYWDYREVVLSNKTILQEKLRDLSEITGLTDKEIELVQNLQADLQKALPTLVEVIDLIKNEQRGEATRFVVDEIKPLLEQMDVKMEEFFHLQQLQSTVSIKGQNELFDHQARLFGLAGLFSLLMLFVLCLSVDLNLVRSVLPEKVRWLSQSKEVGTEMEGCVMLALSTFRRSGPAVDTAIQMARDIKKLYIVYVIDINLARYLVGCEISPEMQDRCEADLLKQYEKDGLAQVEDIALKARMEGIQIESAIQVGQFTTVCLDVVKRAKPSSLVTTRSRRPQWVKILFGSPVDELIEKADCPVQVV